MQGHMSFWASVWLVPVCRGMSHPLSSCTAARTSMQMLQKWRLCCSSMCCCSIFMDGLGRPPLGSQMAHEYAVMSCVHTWKHSYAQSSRHAVAQL